MQRLPASEKPIPSNQKCETEREQSVPACPSFIIVSTFAEDLLNQFASSQTAIKRVTSAVLRKQKTPPEVLGYI